MEKVPFESTVESLIDLEARLRNTERKEVQEFCNKALWSYAKYDSSEIGTRARQVCTQERIMQRKTLMFPRKGGRGARNGNGGKRGKKPGVARKQRKRKTAKETVVDC